MVDRSGQHGAGLFPRAETQRLLEAPPYWAFCWASGLALARWIVAHPEHVAGRQSWISAAARASPDSPPPGPARRGWSAATSISLALAACRANAQANAVQIETLDDFSASTERFDLILAADVLYDRANLPLLDLLQARAERILLADSRVRDSPTRLHPHRHAPACTLPDLAEPTNSAAWRSIGLSRPPCFQARRPHL